MNNLPQSKHQIGKAALLGVGLFAGMLVAVGIFIGVLVCYEQRSIKRYTVKQMPPPPTVEDIQNAIPLVLVENQYVVATGTDAFGRYVTQTDGYGNPGVKNYSVQFVNDEFVVDWHRGAKPLSYAEVADILKKIDPEIKNNQVLVVTPEEGGIWNETCVGYTGAPECQMYIYEAGVLAKPSIFAGKKVYLVFMPGSAPGNLTSFYHTIAILDETSHQFVSFVDSLEGLPSQFQTGIIRHVFSELTPPKTLTASQNGVPETATLVYVKSYHPTPTNTLEGAFENRGGITNVKDHAIVSYTPYNNAATRFVHALDKKGADYGPVYRRDKGYHIILPDGSVQVYDLLPDFMVSNAPAEAEKMFYPPAYTVRVTWTDGRVENTNERYILGGTIGSLGFCSVGVIPCTNIVTNESWFSENNLIAVGKTFQGDSVYELNDQITNPFYRSLFEFGYIGSKVMKGGGWNGDNWDWNDTNWMNDPEKYEDYLSDNPLFFWKDPDGNWRVYQKAYYQTTAECGKPVIYLYPERDTTVRVIVEPNGGFTKVEPEYPSDGWLVRATPQSQLYNFADKKTYQYLFWEGIGYNYARPQEGFVFAKGDVPVKVRDVLRKLGLNEKETEDFMEFWQPKLIEKPYVFVTFLPQAQFDAMAPLTVSPRPDTVIRVFMDYEPLEKPVAVQPLSIHTPERKGFTVVEWGGALHPNLQISSESTNIRIYE